MHSFNTDSYSEHIYSCLELTVLEYMFVWQKIIREQLTLLISQKLICCVYVDIFSLSCPYCLISCNQECIVAYRISLDENDKWFGCFELHVLIRFFLQLAMHKSDLLNQSNASSLFSFFFKFQSQFLMDIFDRTDTFLKCLWLNSKTKKRRSDDDQQNSRIHFQSLVKYVSNLFILY